MKSELLWRPLILFPKMKKVDQTKTYGGTRDNPITYSNGNLIYVEAFQMKFSCPFEFAYFPFDSHMCCLDFRVVRAQNMKLNTVIIFYDNKSTEKGQIAIENLPFQFEVKLSSMKVFQKVSKHNQKKNYHTGMCLKMKRKFPHRLLTSYYYPTTAFALLSMISFLIDPDIVRNIFLNTLISI